MRNVLMYLLLVAVLATVAQAASVTLSTGPEADFDLLSGGPLFTERTTFIALAKLMIPALRKRLQSARMLGASRLST